MTNQKFAAIAHQLQTQVLQLKPDYQAQGLLEEFYAMAHFATEEVRIKLAQQLWSAWQKNTLPVKLFPAVPERADWWYLIQLFALDRHVAESGKPIHFDLSKAGELVVLPPFTSPSLQSLSLIWQIFWREVEKNQNLAEFEQKKMTRLTIDALLDQHSSVVLSQLGLDPVVYELRHIHFAELVRVGEQLSIGFDKTYVHVAGYRQRSDGQLDGLLAGNSEFGGCRFIDSWWLNMYHDGIKFCLVISQKHEL